MCRRRGIRLQRQECVLPFGSGLGHWGRRMPDGFAHRHFPRADCRFPRKTEIQAIHRPDSRHKLPILCLGRGIPDERDKSQRKRPIPALHTEGFPLRLPEHTRCLRERGLPAGTDHQGKRRRRMQRCQMQAVPAAVQPVLRKSSYQCAAEPASHSLP